MPKNYFLLLFVFIYSVANAQIINFTDPNLKAAILSMEATYGNFYAKDANDNYIVVDTNQDDEIQISEAEQVTELYFNAGGSVFFTDLTGLGSFSNLKILSCIFILTDSVDFSGIMNLEILVINNNLNLTSVNITGLSHLRNLFCSDIGITELDLSGLTDLEYFSSSYNMLTSLDFHESINLKELYCDDNWLASLNVDGLDKLEELRCENNELVELNLTSLSSLKKLYCTNNHLESLDISNCPNLLFLYCSANELTTMDASGNPELFGINISSNNLESLIIKNGASETFDFNDNHNLSYVCADAYEIDQVESLIELYGYENCEVTSACLLDNPDFILDNIFTIYPNPAEDTLTIKGGMDILQNEIYNLMGQLIYTAKGSGNEISIDVSGFESGAYILKTITGNGFNCNKFIKQ